MNVIGYDVRPRRGPPTTACPTCARSRLDGVYAGQRRGLRRVRADLLRTITCCRRAQFEAMKLGES